MHLLLTLLLLGQPNFPAAGQTTWMRPDAFRLYIGMPRLEALRILSEGGFHAKSGDKPGEYVIDYDDDKSLTLDFQKERLHSIRFELFAFRTQVRKAFEEESRHLRTARGLPKKETAALLIYDEALPNIMAVLSDDPKSENGKKGIGLLAIRYYDPR
ncbi:MAG TPA: hypothetical protein VGF48_13605 [Thermoanaerobaculia bacterium]|jgi:hypothetical protein